MLPIEGPHANTVSSSWHYLIRSARNCRLELFRCMGISDVWILKVAVLNLFASKVSRCEGEVERQGATAVLRRENLAEKLGIEN